MEDGIALFLSLLQYLDASSVKHSFFLLTTHFSDYLKEDLLRDLRHPIQYQQMNVLLDQSTSQAITPLYQVIDGICQDSLGIRCAASLGLLAVITDRAQEVGMER